MGGAHRDLSNVDILAAAVLAYISLDKSRFTLIARSLFANSECAMKRACLV